MGSRIGRVVAVAIACLAVASYPCRAMAAPTAAQRETARRLMDEGKERARGGDKERALQAYQKAHELMHVPTTGVALARAHVALGHLVEARDVALEVTRMRRDASEPAVFERSRREAADLDASLKSRIPTLRIVIKGDRAARLQLDDAELALALVGEPVALNPGKHTLVVQNAEGAEERTEVELAERDAKDIELAVPGAAPAAAPGASAELAGPPPVADAAHARKGERTKGAKVLVYGGFGVAIAGLAVGGVTGALTLSRAGDVKSQCDNGICDPSVRGELDSASSLATISTIGFAVAGAGALAGVVGLVLPRKKTEAALAWPGQRAAVWVGPGGLGVRGSF